MAYGTTLGIAAALTLGCRTGDAPPDVGPPTALGAPAGPDAMAPSLAAGPDGAVVLAWTVREDGGGSVRYARLAGDRFGPVHDVVSHAPLFVNWADHASVLPLGGDTVVAHWLERSGAGPYAYGVRVARSADDGAHWSDPAWLHEDRSPTEHGFVTLWRGADGAVGAAWLDGRRTAPAAADGDGHAHRAPRDAAMTVRAGSLGADGAAGPEAEVDARSCDCCATAATAVRDGMLLAWRDRTADEVRDIVVARRTSAGWSPPAPVHADGWVTRACPVNGPALASRGDSVVLAWYTQARDTAKVLVAFSTDGGRRFGAPVRVDAGAPLGPVGVVRDDAGYAVVSWHEGLSRDSAEVRVRRVAPSGARSAGRVLALVAATRRAGVTRMVRDGASVVLAWTVAGEHPALAVVRAPLVPR